MKKIIPIAIILGCGSYAILIAFSFWFIAAWLLFSK